MYPSAKRLPSYVALPAPLAVATGVVLRQYGSLACL